MPEEHHSTQGDNDHEDGDAHEERRGKVQPQEEKGDEENGHERQGYVQERVFHYREILFVEHVEHPTQKTQKLINYTQIANKHCNCSAVYSHDFN